MEHAQALLFPLDLCLFIFAGLVCHAAGCFACRLAGWIRECIADVAALNEAGQLFTPDTFAPLAADFKNKSNVIKALQDVWHSPQPPCCTLRFRSLVAIVLILVIFFPS